MRFVRSACMLILVLASVSAFGQSDPLQNEAKAFHSATGDKLTILLEERTRWEEKYGVTFGKDVNQQDMLSRLRIGMQYRPVRWLVVSGLGQDSRVPFYGKPAPNSMRDTIDLQESYLRLSSAEKTGWTFSFGRSMLNYGETRVIGSPQWSNVSRTYDFGRGGFSNSRSRLEVLLVSPTVVQPDKFNQPDLGNRIWGAYDVFPRLWHGASLDVYALRHSQNKIGGWTGKGTLGVNSFGSRLYGPLPAKVAYSLEAIGQTGHLGIPDQRAFAWFAGVSRPGTVKTIPVNITAEFKAASGSRNGSGHSSTYDQLSPANHDKFGHMDLFGWRNLKTFKTLETVNLTKAAAFNLMYTDQRLFSASDALYNSQGSQVAISKNGTAGTHVGQELDSFLTYKVGAHTFYAGFGHFFKGEFVDKATKGINPRYFYLAQEYTFK